MVYILSWWLLIEILGLAALPIAFRALRWLPDRGYAFSKAIGLLIASYLVWLGAITGFLRNDVGGILFTIVAVFGISTFILLKRNNLSEFATILRQKRNTIIIIELLFTIAFIAWVILRAYAPDKIMSAGGEKFMEMAFLNGVLNSPRFPPLDPWLSGFAISYYYFGYVMMGVLTRFTGAPAGIGFELYDALLFSLTAIGVFGIVYNLVAAGRAIWMKSLSPKNVEGDDKEEKPRQPILYGLFGFVLVLIAGNLEGFLEVLHTRGLLSTGFWRWIDIPGLADSPITGSWLPPGGFFACCWRASRVLQDYDLLKQPVGVSPITEFPMFSFLLGDNHPHVLALPFVLLIIALAFNLILRQVSLFSIDEPGGNSEAPSWKVILLTAWRNFFSSEWILLLFYAFCLGSLGFLNTWDMPIYLGLLVLAYGTGEYLRKHKIDLASVLHILMLGISLVVGAVLFYLLFYLSFSSQVGGILPYVFMPTRLPQFLVMFGLFIYVLIWFLVVLAVQKARQEGRKTYWSRFISTWGWIIVGWIAVVLFFLLAIIFAAGSGVLNNPAVQALLGGGSLGQALSEFARERLANPWLMLLLTAMLALTLAALIYKRPSTQPDPLESASSQAMSRTSVDASTSFTLLLVLMGLLLTMSVEILYLRDSFGVRMNTVFKFYYQAWVMFGITSAYSIWWLLNRGKDILRRIGSIFFISSTILLIGAALVYPLIAGYSRVDGFRTTPKLDGTANLAAANPDDWAAIAWLKNNVTGVPVILEAPGKSYNYEGRISAFSGFPAVLGWAYHEGQWRGNFDQQSLREPDIQTIYTTRSGDQALELLRKWGVKYVIVGETEINYIQQLCADPNRACNLSLALSKFDTVLTPVFQQGNTTIYVVPDSTN